MANVPFRRLICFLQRRFYNAPPSSKPPIKSPKATAVYTPIKTNYVSETNSDVVTPHPLSSSFTVQYLVNSCGLPLKSAISTSKKVNLDEKNEEQFDSIVSFLKSQEFSDSHLAKLIEKHPAVLYCRISRNLEPKIRFLAENGVEGSLLPKIVVSTPAILTRSLDAQLKPAMEFLKKYVGCADKILVAIERGTWLLTSDLKTLQRNVDYLIEQGVPSHRIQELIVLQPRCMYQDVGRMVYGVEMITRMGIKPDAPRFIHTLRVILSLSELNWKRKVRIFESMGWSYGDVMSTFVRSPHCLSCSEEKLRGSMDFLVNTVKIDPEIVIGYPKLLMYSKEKRIIPRYTVWKILEERKLLQGKKFVWLLNKSEKIFIDQYVTKYSDTIPHLLKIYNSSKKMGKMAA